MLQEILLEIIIEKVFDGLYERIRSTLKDKNYRFEIKKSDLQEALSSHYDTVVSWMNFVNFQELRSPKMLTSVYIDLDIQLTPRKWLPKDMKNDRWNIHEIVNRDYNIVILGDIGSGKTTTLQYICKKTLESENDQFIDSNFPILIPLRNLEKGEDIFEHLRKILGIYITHIGPTNTAGDALLRQNLEEKYTTKKLIFNYIEEIKPVILIDGFDEISIERQNEIYSQLNELFLHSTGAKIVLTCRSGAYDITLPKSEVFEICSLNNIQTKKFVGKWLDNDKIETNIFLKQLADSPFSDTAIRPLTLAHLCALYKKYKRIPAYPKSVYKRIVALLLEDWDIQRGIARASSFADFEIDRKLEFLYALSYGLSTQTGSKVFSEDALIDIFNKIHNNFGINKNERKKVIKELESQTGLLVKSSYDTYEFAHASIQEYLTAEYIVRLPKVYQFDVYTKSLMDELAITICLSSNPTVYFATLVTDTFANASFDQNQIARFLRRLKLENPDFSKESLTAVGLLSIYTKFFTTIVNQEALEVSDISVSQTFWKAMIMKNKVKEAFQDFNKMYYVVNKKNGVLVFNLDLLQVKTGFNYPNQLFMNQKLYELIYKKSNRPHQH